MSSPSSVLVYSPETINKQLDMAARMYLEQASVSPKGSKDIVVNLPRICQWFLDDFGTQDDLLQKVAKFLKHDDQLLIDRAWSDDANVNIRFNDFSFKCRPLSVS